EGVNPENNAVIIIEPFERGFGNTLGNALRRVLLSCISGFAVTSIKIDGISHEYSVIEGVKEDVSDIIMNIKSLAIAKETSSPCTIKLFSDKEGPVLAGSIEVSGGAEIINKDLVICTLNKGGKINIQMNVECGKGYYTVSKSKKNESDRKSTRLNSSHVKISYAVFCLKKKNM